MDHDRRRLKNINALLAQINTYRALELMILTFPETFYTENWETSKETKKEFVSQRVNVNIKKIAYIA